MVDNKDKNRTKTFHLVSPFTPQGDQEQAIATLTHRLKSGVKEQVLLGVTGSGKTFTMANVIATIGKPALIISHNKTLAAQLYQEFRDFFPHNAVSYFVSYYDYYQPEAYIPQSDTYIEKETEINEEIDKLRLGATANLLTRSDSIIVASVSCIYNIGSPREYGHFVIELRPGMKIARESILDRLITLQYERNNYGFTRGAFRVRGDTIDLFPAYVDYGLRMRVQGGILTALESIDPLTGKRTEMLTNTMIYPAKHYMTDPRSYKNVFTQIRSDLDKQIKFFSKQGKHIEAQRIRERVNYDLEMLTEMGYVNGIENYSRYFDGRNPGDPPYTLFDYFEEATSKGPALGASRPDLERDWLLFIDESHMTIPQIRGMYHGDRSRKQTLIDYGFRLPASIDNRPLRFEEFLRIKPQTIYVSATPDDWEISRAQDEARNFQFPISKNQSTEGIVEQLVRPTGLVDPTVSVRPTQGQIEDIQKEIEKRVASHQRVLVTTLTKRMAEDLAKYLEDRGTKVHYLHSDIVTLERMDILADLRLGTYDVVVGINLLREGLDLPEVSLVAILDADKEGFLRSRTSLIQTMGRAARHAKGEVIMYADTVTTSMQHAISEVERRRTVQLAYNKLHHITPESIVKPIRKKLVENEEGVEAKHDREPVFTDSLDELTPVDRKKLIARLTKTMNQASRDLDFEQAIKLRNLIASISLG